MKKLKLGFVLNLILKKFPLFMFNLMPIEELSKKSPQCKKSKKKKAQIKSSNLKTEKKNLFRENFFQLNKMSKAKQLEKQVATTNYVTDIDDKHATLSKNN